MIMRDLAHHFAPRLEDDQRAADHELMHFRRMPQETFELMLMRCHDVLNRQRQEGFRLFSWREHSETILRQCGLPSQIIYQMFVERGMQNGVIRPPTTAQEFESMVQQIRIRVALLENTAANPLRDILNTIPDGHDRQDHRYDVLDLVQTVGKGYGFACRQFEADQHAHCCQKVDDIVDHLCFYGQTA